MMLFIGAQCFPRTLRRGNTGNHLNLFTLDLGNIGKQTNKIYFLYDIYKHSSPPPPPTAPRTGGGDGRMERVGRTGAWDGRTGIHQSFAEAGALVLGLLNEKSSILWPLLCTVYFWWYLYSNVFSD